MIALTVASWRHHLRRSVGTVLAVLIGVGFCAATLTLTTALRAEPVDSLTDGVDVLSVLLDGFAVVSLVVAGLVVANTLRIVMAQRARDFALLRCVGAERGQLVRLVAGEALLLGAIGTVLGLAVGVGIGGAAIAMVNRTSEPAALSFETPGAAVLLWPMAGGLLVTLAASLAPALGLARLAPVQALRPAAEGVGRTAALRAPTAALGGLAVACGALLMVFGAASGLLPAGLLGGVVSFVGVLTLCPVLVPGMISLASGLRSRLPRRMRGRVPARLAALNAVRHPRRTAATAAALLVGITLISTMAVGAASVSATEASALDRVTPVDLTVSGGTGPSPAGPSAGLVRRVTAQPGVDAVVDLRGVSAVLDGRRVTVASLTAAEADRVVRDPDLRALVQRPDTLVLPADVVAPAGPVRLSPVGADSAATAVRVVVQPSAISGGPLLVSPGTLARLGGTPRPVALYVKATDSADPEGLISAIGRDIRAADQGGGLGVSGGFVKRSTYDSVVSVLLTVSTSLLAVAVLIALVGVGSTLGLSVLERTREHGLLRALGLTRSQLRGTLVREGALLAGAASLLGVALGLLYGWAGTATLLHGVISHPPTFAVPWRRLAVVVAVSLAAGMAAALLPARRAARVSPARALADE